jgi:hypothetical protein
MAPVGQLSPYRVPERVSPLWFALKAVLLLTVFVLVGLRLHPFLALVVLLALTDPFLLILGEAFRPRRGASHPSP